MAKAKSRKVSFGKKAAKCKRDNLTPDHLKAGPLPVAVTHTPAPMQPKRQGPTSRGSFSINDRIRDF